MSDNLPPLVIEEILRKLPTKCLLKCRTVCKSWYNLINTPHFISTHLTTSTEDNNKLLLVRSLSGHDNQYTFHFNNEEMGEYLRLPFPFTSFPYRTKQKIRLFHGYHRVLDSHNGLVCLYFMNHTAVDPEKYGHKFILWNPCIGKYLLVPPSNIGENIYKHASIVGFCFDDRCNDFKIFRIVSCYCSKRKRCEKPALVECEVYSLNSGLWRNVTGDLPHYDVVTHDAYHAYVGGALHWVVNNGAKNLLMVIDARDEVFSEISVPESLSDVSVLDSLRVYKYESSLAIVDMGDERVWQSRVMTYQYTCQIWVMKEYGKVESWMKLRVLDRPEIGISFSQFLEFRNSKQAFVKSAEGNYIVCIDLEARKVMYVTVGIGDASVHAYTESLALLDKGTDITTD